MMRDLLILIAIVAIAVGLMVPGVQKVSDSHSASVQALCNLKQMSLAVHMVNDIYRRLPPATGTFGGMLGGNRSLGVHLLPYIEQSALYSQLQNTETASATIAPYTAPLDFTTTDFVAVQNYAANVRIFTDLGVNTAFNANVAGITPSGHEGWNTSKIPDTFKDGTSTTIMFATRYANSGAAAGGGSVNCSAYDAWIGKNNWAFFGVSTLASAPTANSSGGWQLAPKLTQINCQFGAVAHSFGNRGLQVSCADASIRSISPSISTFTWNAAMQPNDGNKLGSDWE